MANDEKPGIFFMPAGNAFYNKADMLDAIRSTFGNFHITFEHVPYENGQPSGWYELKGFTQKSLREAAAILEKVRGIETILLRQMQGGNLDLLRPADDNFQTGARLDPPPQGPQP